MKQKLENAIQRLIELVRELYGFNEIYSKIAQTLDGWYTNQEAYQNYKTYWLKIRDFNKKTNPLVFKEVDEWNWDVIGVLFTSIGQTNIARSYFNNVIKKPMQDMLNFQKQLEEEIKEGKQKVSKIIDQIAEDDEIIAFLFKKQEIKDKIIEEILKIHLSE